MRKCIMAVGAHADDVELHFGGTLFKYMDKGYRIVYVMATNNMCGCKRVRQPDGSWRKTECFDASETMRYRKREAEDAARLFGAAPIHLDHPQRHCRVPDGGVLRLREVRFGCALPEGVPPDTATILTAHEDTASVERLAGLIVENDPEAVFTHGFAEVNQEHHCTFLLVVKAYWRAVEKGCAGSLLSGVRGIAELGRYGSCWETFVDIDGYVDRRMAAVRKHVSQYPPEFDHGAAYWREIAERRGAACGVPAAEVFNFVNSEVTATAENEILSELLLNRAPQKPWGLD